MNTFVCSSVDTIPVIGHNEEVLRFVGDGNTRRSRWTCLDYGASL